MENKPILVMNNICKSFPGVKALDQVSLTIQPGKVHTLMGENGAGKSTLMKCLFGIYHPDEGEIYLEGKKVQFTDTRNAMDHGIAMIHQELHPVRTQNVMENIWIGRIPYKKSAGVRWVDNKKMYEDTVALFDELGMKINPRALVATLSVSLCQLLEIARAVSYGAKVIIMDEPTSSLTETESELLFKIIGRLKEQGVTIIYISHKIKEVLHISDEITIMRDGKVMGTWPRKELTTDLIVRRMVGREMNNLYPQKQHSPGEVYVKIENLTSVNPNSFHNVSFEVRKGEILGIGGLVGAQRTELVEAIFGLRKIAKGSISIAGKKINITCPQDAIGKGLALLTEERRVTGIFPMLSVKENIVISKLKSHKKEFARQSVFLNEKERNADAQHYVDKLSIKTPSLKTEIQCLSGGNQQKALLGRWLLVDPEILILDEPTRGIDVGAKYEIYCLMEKMTQEGKCVIMVSSEMQELMGLSDRILIMCEGRVSGILEGDSFSEEKIMYLASMVDNNVNKEEAANA